MELFYLQRQLSPMTDCLCRPDWSSSKCDLVIESLHPKAVSPLRSYLREPNQPALLHSRNSVPVVCLQHLLDCRKFLQLRAPTDHSDLRMPNRLLDRMRFRSYRQLDRPDSESRS